MMIKRLLPVCVLCACLLVTGVVCAEAAQPLGSGTSSGGGGKVTTKIDADNMVYDSAKQQVVFSSNVTVTHPDFIMKAAKLTLYMASNEKKANAGEEKTLDVQGGRVERIVAEKNVRITLPEGRKAVCERGTYYVAEDKLVMDGTPRPILTENQNNISADVINFYMETNQSVAKGDVKVNFVSDDTKKPSAPLPASQGK